MWLSSNNSVKFEYWQEQTTRDVIRYNKLTGTLKLWFITIMYKIQQTPEKLSLIEIAELEDYF